MLKIRFFRTGKKHQPFYRIRVADKNNPPASGRFVEDVGFYNPTTKECDVKKERVLHWIEKGAQPSDRVRNILIKNDIIRGKKSDVVSFTKKRQEKINKKNEEINQKKIDEQETETAEELVKEEATKEVEAQEENKTNGTQEEVKEEEVTESKESDNSKEEEKKK